MKNTVMYTHKTDFGTVFLKGRKNGKNPERLYLEIYLKSTQKRHLEFLKLSFTGNSITDGKIKQEAIGKCLSYSWTEKKTTELTFTDFFLEQTKRIDKLQSRNTPLRALKKLQEYSKADVVYFQQIDEPFLVGFREWLLTRALHRGQYKPCLLRKNTAHLYWSMVMGFANRAQRKGFIALSAYTASDIPTIGQSVKPPITLTEEEIIKLQSTPYKRPEICKALMFQFACGQRWGDVRDMTWEQIIKEEGQYMIVLKQEKTDKVLPSFISRDLMNWVGEGKERKGRLFTKLPMGTGAVVHHMNKWCHKAGISKRVGTHTMRRTCATLLYKKGVELLTISKILGHCNTDITRRYIGIDEKDIKKGLDKLKEVTNRFTFNQVA